MRPNGIIAAVMIGCSCNEQEAIEYINGELDNLRDLASLNGLEMDDIDLACSNLGIDYDYAEYFINRLAC